MTKKQKYKLDENGKPLMPLTKQDEYYLYEFDGCMPTNGWFKWNADYKARQEEFQRTVLDAFLFNW